MNNIKQIVIHNHIVEYYIFSNNNTTKYIIFIHGWGSQKEVWSTLLYDFIEEFNIICIDLPGFGNSEDLKTVYDLQMYVFCLKEFLNKLKITDYVLIGHSFGGAVIVKGLLINAISPKAIILFAPALLRKKNVFRSVIAKVSKLVKIFLRSQGLKRVIYELLGSADYININNSNLKLTFSKVVNEDLSKYLSNITVPTLIFWSKQDNITPLKQAYEIHSLIRGSTLHIYDGDHFFFLKTPSYTITAQIKHFLKKVLKN